MPFICELEPEADIKTELAQRDAIIASMGFDLSESYIKETYGVEVTKKEQPSWDNHTQAAFNEPLKGIENTFNNSLIKEELNANKTPIKDDEIDAALESEEFSKIANEIEAEYSAQINTILENAKSYEEAAELIANAQIFSKAFSEHMSRTLANSHAKGAVNAAKE